jgi:hypothetical protein
LKIAPYSPGRLGPVAPPVIFSAFGERGAIMIAAGEIPKLRPDEVEAADKTNSGISRLNRIHAGDAPAPCAIVSAAFRGPLRFTPEKTGEWSQARQQVATEALRRGGKAGNDLPAAQTGLAHAPPR